MIQRTLLLWGGVGILIVAMIVGVVVLSGRAPESGDNNTDKSATEVKETDWLRGSITAEVVLIEYADFQCPACGAYYPLVKQMEEKFGSELVVVYRHFPLVRNHKNAEAAARAAEAAGKQGKFWEMHDVIFEKQSVWSDESNVEEIFLGYARTLGLNETQFVQNAASSEAKDKIFGDYNEGVSLGVNGTPTFFLNGKKIVAPRSYEEFEKAISDALAQWIAI